MDRPKRSFLRMVSHELRTPLNSVLGFSEIISRELYGPISDPRYREHAEIIHQSGLRLMKLVNQVLEIARLDAGAADLHIQAEAPRTAAAAAVRAMESVAAAKGVEIVLEVEEDVPLVMADARGLQSALEALLENALDASPPGERVRTRIHAAAGAVVFEVCDRGPGVALHDIRRLMQPFEQGEDPLIRHKAGAGLGLSIVSLLCREMGGALTLRSSPGRGLTARIRLPAAEVQSGAAATPPAPPPCAAPIPARLEARRPAA